MSLATHQGTWKIGVAAEPPCGYAALSGAPLKGSESHARAKSPILACFRTTIE